MALSSFAIDPRAWVELEDEGSRQVACAKGCPHITACLRLFSPHQKRSSWSLEMFLKDHLQTKGWEWAEVSTFTASRLPLSQVPEMYLALAQDVPRQLPMARPL